MLLFEHTISAYWIGNFRECRDGCQTLLGKTLPEYLETAVRKNLAFAEERLRETQ